MGCAGQYLDIQEDSGPRQLSEDTLLRFKALDRRLRSRGAVLADRLHGLVSHVIIADDDWPTRRSLIQVVFSSPHRPVEG